MLRSKVLREATRDSKRRCRGEAKKPLPFDMHHLITMNDIKKIDFNALKKYFNVEKVTKKVLYQCIREKLKTKKDVEKFVNAFKDDLYLFPHEACRHLRVSYKLLCYFEEKNYIKKRAYNNTFDLLNIRIITQTQVKAWKKEYEAYMEERKRLNILKAPLKAKATRQYRKDNMPKWLKEVKFTWIEEISPNLKRLAVIAKLANEDYIQHIRLKLGKMELIGKINHDFRVEFYIKSKATISEAIAIKSMTHFKVSPNGKKRLENQIRNYINKTVLLSPQSFYEII